MEITQSDCSTTGGVTEKIDALHHSSYKSINCGGGKAVFDTLGKSECAHRRGLYYFQFFFL